MAVPDFQTLMLPLLKLASDGQPHTLAEALDRLAQEFQLSEDDRAQLLRSGQTRFYNRIGWTTTYLKKAGLLQAVGPGRFQLTDRGRDLLASQPAAIDVAFLDSRYPEISEFRKARSRREVSDEEPPAIFNAADGTWNQRAGVGDRVQATLEMSIPNETMRLEALRFLASAIETADEERGGAWYLRETERGLRLMTGRVLACEIAPSKIRVTVIGPIGEDVRSALEVETEKDSEFKHVPGGLLLTFPLNHAPEALALLRHGLNSFVDDAMARVRRSVNLIDHTPEAVTYIARVVGRELPQPVAEAQSSEQSDDGLDEDDSSTSREPRVRGRAPIFEHGQRSIASLMSDIEREVIALPDLQRPFVWEDTGARQLLDSLFVGFPVGTLVFWHTSNDKDARALGAERPGLRATTLVIDGQQRLTSLYAVMRGVDVVGKDGATRKITIAFRPRDGRFEVADAAIRNDPEFLPNVTELWDGRRLTSQIRRDLINALRDKGRAIDDKYEDAVDRNLGRAHAITDYRFPTVDIRKTATTQDEEVTDEDVAEIFVRINNQGTRLGQADFVLTLLSVFHGGLRDRIEERARAMSLGTVVGIDTQQLLRAVCGVAFGRARMSAIYRYLRGVEPTTGEADASERMKRLDQLDDAAKLCMETTPWRDYLLRVQHAGFVSQALVASKNAIVNGYAFYIRGRKVGVPKSKLDETIARWVFGTLLTARYSTASETIFEQDLARVARLKPDDAEGFVRALDEAMSETLTGDYWTQTLVSALETEKARAPAALAFPAAQVVLGTRALFSDQFLRNLLDPPAGGARAASEAHHLFPTAWLHSRGVRERRFVNQVANLADVGWHENSLISGRVRRSTFRVCARKLVFMTRIGGAACARSTLFRWDGSRWSTRSFSASGGDGWQTSFVWRSASSEASRRPLHSRPRGSCPVPRMCGNALWRPSAHFVASFARSTPHVFGEAAAKRIEDALPERERETLARALRARPAGSEPLNIVDYLYLGQIPALSTFGRCAGRQAAASICRKPNRACPKRDCARPRG
jgi:hypothetical protein